jgi:ribosomal protein S18 acetylase RimI-like enzyme
MALLLVADPSAEHIRCYLPASLCYAARRGDTVAGVYVVAGKGGNVYELMNIAVDPAHQQQGIGKQLLRHAIELVRGLGAARLEVGTGAFGYQLGFYQKAGFRVFAVERDFFLRNYREAIYEDGIQHKDMLRLAIDFPT